MYKLAFHQVNAKIAFAEHGRMDIKSIV